MSNSVYINGDYLLTPLGLGTEVNFQRIASGHTGVSVQDRPEISRTPFPAALIDAPEVSTRYPDSYTRLEKQFLFVLEQLIAQYGVPLGPRTLLVISTTKGNISLLHSRLGERYPADQVLLPAMAHAIGSFLGLDQAPVVLSNACISGSLAITVASRLLRSGAYDQALVVGGDEVSAFIHSGFASFQALSDGICKPFDKHRNGINLGEAIAGVYLSREKQADSIRIAGSGTYNDANHISGPSRTGEGLYRSIRAALAEANIAVIDYVSAHGTATLYNDEMEAIALSRAGLSAVPTNSLKAYYGHTLGASGLLETVLGIHSLKNNLLIKSLGYETHGVSEANQILTENQATPLQSFIKLASGFGGCNIATVFEKVG